MDDGDLTGRRASRAEGNPHRPSLKRLGGLLLDLLGNHAELLAIELQEEKSRSLQLLITLGLGLIFGLLLIIGLSVAILIACWEHYRWQGILGLCLLYLIGLTLSLLRALRLAQRGLPFQASLEELARTKEQLLP